MWFLIISFLVIADLLALTTIVYVIADMAREAKAAKKKEKRRKAEVNAE